jgi:hypothetical protein
MGMLVGDAGRIRVFSPWHLTTQPQRPSPELEGIYQRGLKQYKASNGVKGSRDRPAEAGL